MKKLLVLLLAFPLFLPAQQAPTWLYSTARNFDWNNATQVWDTASQFHYQYYNGSGLLQEEVREYWNGNFQNEARFIYAYTPAGKRSQVDQESWAGNQWVPAFQRQYTYDSLDNETSYLLIDLQAGPDTLTHEQIFRDYDSQGRQIRWRKQIWNSNNQQFDWDGQVEYTYGTGAGWTSETWYSWTNGAWEANYRFRDMVWRDYSLQERDSFYQDFYVNGQWEPNYKASIRYGTLGSFTTYRLNYDPLTAVYDSAGIFIYDNNAMGDVQEIRQYSLFGGQWTLTYGRYYPKTYNSDGNIVETIRQEYDFNTSSYQNFNRTDYLGYVLDAEESVPTTSFAAWAPHPVGEQGWLLVEGKPGTLRLEVYDLQGKMVGQWERLHAGGKQQHAFEIEIPEGAYMYRAELNGRGSSGRLLVE